MYYHVYYCLASPFSIFYHNGFYTVYFILVYLFLFSQLFSTSFHFPFDLHDLREVGVE
jgi:hypothetical protein